MQRNDKKITTTEPNLIQSAYPTSTTPPKVKLKYKPEIGPLQFYDVDEKHPRQLMQEGTINCLSTPVLWKRMNPSKTACNPRQHDDKHPSLLAKLGKFGELHPTRIMYLQSKLSEKIPEHFQPAMKK